MILDEGTNEAVLELAMAAGHILLENGAEISRVEETMARICHHYGVESDSEFILSNGIFMTAGGVKEPFFARVRHIPVSGTHLDKVAAVNQLSREIAENRYTVEQALAVMQKIRQMPGKRSGMKMLASGVGAAAFCYLFGGSILDSAATFLVGILLYGYVLYLAEPHLSKIVTNIGGGILLTLLCSFFHWSGLGQQLNYMIIGSIMPLIPGMSFVNSIRDIADGDYISGSVRMLDALLAFICIAFGVGTGITLFHLMTGGL